jgi:hypothetical protein
VNFVLFFLVGVAVAPLLIALHELGHAAAALALTDGPVVLRVGTREQGSGLAVGSRLIVAVGRGLTRGGSVHHMPAQTRRDAAIIVAAGPAATLLGGLVAAILAFRLYVHGGPRLELYVFAAAAVDSLGALLLNGSRDLIKQPGGQLHPTDGEQLARLAGAEPREQRRRTSPIAWIALALIAGLTVFLAFDDPAAGIPMILVLAFIFLRASRDERAR